MYVHGAWCEHDKFLISPARWITGSAPSNGFRAEKVEMPFDGRKSVNTKHQLDRHVIFMGRIGARKWEKDSASKSLGAYQPVWADIQWVSAFLKLWFGPVNPEDSEVYGNASCRWHDWQFIYWNFRASASPFNVNLSRCLFHVKTTTQKRPKSIFTVYYIFLPSQKNYNQIVHSAWQYWYSKTVVGFSRLYAN